MSVRVARHCSALNGAASVLRLVFHAPSSFPRLQSRPSASQRGVLGTRYFFQDLRNPVSGDRVNHLRSLIVQVGMWALGVVKAKYLGRPICLPTDGLDRLFNDGTFSLQS